MNKDCETEKIIRRDKNAILQRAVLRKRGNYPKESTVGN